MRSKMLVITALLAMMIVLALPVNAAQNVGSGDLIEHAKEWDGQTILYEGEAIGEVLYRESGAWINVSDGANTLGCWISTDMAKEIKICGRYNEHGDTLRIEGVFHRACADHGGDLDIHAVTLEKIASGYPVLHPLQSRMVWGAAIGIGGGLTAGAAFWLRRKSSACR